MVKIRAKILFSLGFIYMYCLEFTNQIQNVISCQNTVYLLFFHQSFAPITLILVCNLEKVRREVEDDRTCVILIVYQTAS